MRIGRLTIDYRELPLTLSGIELLRPDETQLALSIDRIDGPLEMVPLWASARLRREGDAWQASGVVASGPGDLVLRFSGTGLGSPAGRLEATAEPIRFTPGGLQPEALLPWLGGHAHAVRGTITLEAAWQAGEPPEEQLTLGIDDLTFRTDYGPVGPVAGTITLDRLLPPRTAEPQLLSIERIGLGNLVESLEIEALGAEGTLDADLRFSITEEGRLYIDEGELRARGPGVLRYRPDEPPGFLASQGQSVQMLLSALTDFRFESLSAIVRGYLDDDLTIELQLSGANPELYEGHPIELNVNLEAPVVPLVGAGRDALQLPDSISRSIEKRQR